MGNKQVIPGMLNCGKGIRGVNHVTLLQVIAGKTENQDPKMCIIWWYHLILFIAEQRGYSATLQRNIMGSLYQETCKRVTIIWCHGTQTLSRRHCGSAKCKGHFVKWESLRRNPDGRGNSQWWNPHWMLPRCKYNAPCTVSYSLPSEVSSIIHSSGLKKPYGADVSDSIGLKASNHCVWYWDVCCGIVELFWRDTVAWWGTDFWQISWEV